MKKVNFSARNYMFLPNSICWRFGRKDCCAPALILGTIKEAKVISPTM